MPQRNEIGHAAAQTAVTVIAERLIEEHLATVGV